MIVTMFFHFVVIVCAIILLIALLVAIVLAITGCIKGRRAAWFIGSLAVALVILATSYGIYVFGPRDYWSYQGAYDWWRMPLEYPYQLKMIDGLDEASVSIWADSGVRKEFDLRGIRKVRKYEGMLVGTTSEFCREIGSQITIWFILDLGTGSVERFSSEDEFHGRLAERGISVPPNLVTLSEYWDSYWAK